MEEITILSDSDDDCAIEVLHVNIADKENTAVNAGGTHSGKISEKERPVIPANNGGGKKVGRRKRKRGSRKGEALDEAPEEDEDEEEIRSKRSKEEVQREYNYFARYNDICKLEKYPIYVKRDEPNYELTVVETQNDATRKLRELQLLYVEDAVRAFMGKDAFCAAYPGRPSASKEEGPLTAARRETKKARVKQIQAKWNRENGAWNMPFLFLEDWTTETPDYDRLDAIEFSQECSFKDAGVEKDVTRLRWDKNLRDLEVERGRQRELLIFRDHEKGWSLRALTEFEPGDLITFFVGEINLEVAPSDMAAYDFGLSCKAKKRQVHINAGRRANESRFFPHHCCPNVQSEETVICRRGRLIRAVAFWAIRPVQRGAELNIDYFPGKTLETTNTSAYFEYCFCGHSKCRFSEAKVRAYREKLAKKKGGAVREEAQRQVTTSTGETIADGEMTPPDEDDDCVLLIEWDKLSSRKMKRDSPSLAYFRNEIANNNAHYTIEDPRKRRSPVENSDNDAQGAPEGNHVFPVNDPADVERWKADNGPDANVGCIEICDDE